MMTPHNLAHIYSPVISRKTRPTHYFRQSNNSPPQLATQCWVQPDSKDELKCRILHLSCRQIAFVSDEPFDIDENIMVRLVNSEVKQANIRFCMTCDDGNYQIGGNLTLPSVN